MGCNFYTLKGRHIGKRSAVGLYCWDCGKTLCADGESGVHTGCSYWFAYCPKCGKSPDAEFLEDSAAGREFGFNETKPQRKTGVKSCSSFAWAVPKESIKKLRSVKDEYGRIYTIEEFLAILEECPIQFLHTIGVDFS